MNYGRLAVAAMAATVVYNIYGFLVFGLFPKMAGYYSAYPSVFRPKEGIMSHMPLGFAGMFVGMLVLVTMYAKGYEGGNGAAEGARFGFLIAIFVICVYVIHDYVILNIGGELVLAQAVASLPEWTVTGIAIGMVYQPACNDARTT